MKRVASLSACCSNAFPYGGFAGRWGWVLKWLLGFIVNQFEALPDHLNVEPITSNADVIIQRLEVEADEMASFVVRRIGLVEERG
jgi:hypothetical protein